MSRSSEQRNFGCEAIETFISEFRQEMLFDALQNPRPCTPRRLHPSLVSKLRQRHQAPRKKSEMSNKTSTKPQEQKLQ